MARIQMTELRPEMLRDAQERLGYSDREMANRLHLGTEKTWWRWRTEGLVPTTSLPAVVLVLDLPELLEIFQQGTHGRPDGDGDATRLSEEVAAVRGQLSEILMYLRRRDEEAG